MSIQQPIYLRDRDDRERQKMKPIPAQEGEINVPTIMVPVNPNDDSTMRVGR